MKHKIEYTVEVKKRGLLGPRTVRERRTMWVDEKTYRELKKQKNRGSITLDDLILYE